MFTLRLFASGNVSIKDTNFLNALRANYPSVIDGYASLDTNDAARLTELNLKGYKITDVSELIYFKNIKYLDIANNNISQIPSLNKLKYLVSLKAYNNQISNLPELDFHEYLTEIDVVDNKLISLPVLNNLKNLKSILCKNNQLTTFPNIDSLTQIESIDLSYNLLSSLPNFSNNQKLKNLFINNNQLNNLNNLPIINSLSYVNLSFNFLDFCELNKLLVYSNYASIFIYSNQITSSKSVKIDTLENETLVLSATKSNCDNTYIEWYKNGTYYSTTKDNLLTLKNIHQPDSGTYTGYIKNTNFTYLQFVCDTFWVKIKPCIDTNKLVISATNIPCDKEGNITVQKPNSYITELVDSKNGVLQSNQTGVFQLKEAGMYQIKIRNKLSCTFITKPITVYKSECNHHYITPNNDNENDYFYFNEAVKIFDKNGSKLFESQDAVNWYGISSTNETLSQGLYFAETKSGKLIKISIVY